MSNQHNKPEVNSTPDECPRAPANLEAAIDRSNRLPKNVFSPDWVDFHVFDSDWIFEGAFVEKARAMLHHEGANCACIVDLDRDAKTALATFVIDMDTTIQEYQRRLSGVGFGDGWIYDISRFGCTSDVGSWCIYCERASELAIIGFRVGTMLNKYQFILASLRARKVTSVGGNSSRYEFLSHSISSAWKDEIARNYGE